MNAQGTWSNHRGVVGKLPNAAEVLKTENPTGGYSASENIEIVQDVVGPGIGIDGAE